MKSFVFLCTSTDVSDEHNTASLRVEVETKQNTRILSACFLFPSSETLVEIHQTTRCYILVIPILNCEINTLNKRYKKSGDLYFHRNQTQDVALFPDMPTEIATSRPQPWKHAMTREKQIECQRKISQRKTEL